MKALRNNVAVRCGVTAALALAGFLLSAGSALAGTVQGSFGGLINPVGTTFNVISPPYNAGPTGTTAGLFNMTQNAGQFAASTVDPLQSGSGFKAFCIDLGQFVGQTTWNVVNLANAPVPYNPATGMGAQKAADLAKLFGGNLQGGLITNATDALLGAGGAAAMQLAVWGIVFENSGVYNVNSGSATFASSVSTLANTYLGNITKNISATGLIGLTSDSNQDLVGQVPIPAAVWLFGSALAGLGLICRRTVTAA